MQVNHIRIRLTQEYEKSNNKEDGPERKIIARELEKLLKNEN